MRPLDEERAPDRLEPTVGWRVWDVVELDGALRLCSLSFWTIWLPRRETIAVCRRALAALDWAGLPEHEAPRERCTCGIYATRTATQVLAYASQFPRRRDTVHRILGRVRLWGTVIEAEGGWRASHAYPASLFVPTGRSGRPWRRGSRPAIRIEEVVLGLGDYAVPVELIDCATDRELAELVEPTNPV